MSALANTLLSDQEAKTPLGSRALSSNSTSSISVTTRIDYNLRLTKQAVLVVAKDAQQYSHLASQYLVNLSRTSTDNQANQINVAFVAASRKLNDIQIRCRLIEQLFVNTLFDPEQSLAVSVLKFAQQQGGAISIVIDHGHALSLQIKYELCQLVNLAKKSKLTVNVVIFGLTEAAHQLVINKSLFKNKMALIDAETGQVISFDDKRLQATQAQSTLSTWQKTSLASAILILSIIGFWGYQQIVENLNTQVSPININQNVVKNKARVLLTVNASNAITEQTARPMQRKEKIIGPESRTILGPKLAASSEEINFAILALPLMATVELTQTKAVEVIEIITLSVNADEVKTTTNKINLGSDKSEQGITKNTVVVEIATLQENATNKYIKIDNHYYQNQAVVYEQGYVVQIAGFADTGLWQIFVDNYSIQDIFSYQRLLNEQRFIVVTSKVYPNKGAAKAALKLLPESLNNRQPWLKDISSVINEINTFKR